jgi:tetratricopeptide (TPR) repeat protein
MVCYECGAVLSKSDYCESCGADVILYKKIICLSNKHYNDGLEKAKIRDLSGAAESLRKSLKFNKINVEARNLLGLIYFEMGEAVQAISEWVISRSVAPDKNPAERYLSSVQSNANKLDALNQTIKKYNQALSYAKQGSRDLAIIQLKKVLGQNNRLLKAYHLLALMYLAEDKHDLARKTLLNAKKIDISNTLTMRYLIEVDEYGSPKEVPEPKTPKKVVKKGKEDLVSYKSGNETIIYPAHFKEYSAFTTILNIVIGIVLGGLATIFLIVPNMNLNTDRSSNQALQEANENLTSKNETIKALEKDVDDLQSEIAAMNKADQDNQNVMTEYDNLLKAYQAYIDQNPEGAVEILESLNTDALTTEAKQTFTALNAKMDGELIHILYTQGEEAYDQGNFAEAAEKLQKVVDIDAEYSTEDGYEGDALYLLAQAYDGAADYAKAITCYQEFIAQQSGTSRASNAQERLAAIEREHPQAGNSDMVQTGGDTTEPEDAIGGTQ